jgi:hypothetical protein
VICYPIHPSFLLDFIQYATYPTQSRAGDKIEKNEMGGACGAYGGGESCVQGFGGETLRERGRWGEPDVDERIILGCAFRKWDVGVGPGLGWLRMVTGACECGDEPSGSIKRGEFLD